MKKRYAFLISALSALLLSGCVYSHVSSSDTNESSSEFLSEITSNDEKKLLDLFSVLKPTDTEFRGVTNPSGNTWAIFTPTKNGIISATETSKDIKFETFFSVFDLTDLRNDFDRLGDSSKDAIYYSINTPASFSNIEVIKDHSYVIKYGAFPCQDNYIDTETRLREYVNKELSYSFSYIPGDYKTYSGDFGELKVFFTDEGELVNAFLEREEITNVTFEDDSIVLTDYESMTCDVSDPLNPKRKIPRTIYKLNDKDLTYVKKTGFEYETVFATLDENSTELSGFTGNDGNIWAIFTSSVEGFISLKEIDGGLKDRDSYITVYEKGGIIQSNNFFTTVTDNVVGTVKGVFNDEPATITDLYLVANRPYVIKAGYGPNYGYEGINSFGKHVKESISIVFNTPETLRFTGSEGDVYLKTYNTNQLLGFTVNKNGQMISYKDATISSDGRVVTIVDEYIDSSKRLDPEKVVATKQYTFDFSDQTYTVSEEDVTTHYFYQITGNTAEYEAPLSEDLNIYAKFTALNSGTAAVEEIACPDPYMGFISVFDVTEDDKSLATCFGKTATEENGLVGFLSCNSTNRRLLLNFYAGHTYVIKVGLLPKSTPYNYDPNSTYSRFKGGIERMRFEFFDPILLSFYDSENNLFQITPEGFFLNCQPLDVTPSSDGLSFINESEKTFADDSELAVTWTETVYTVDPITHTFTTTTITHNVDLILGAFDTLPVSCNVATSPNGSAIIKFTSPKTGIITVNLRAPNSSYSLDAYTDKMCTNRAIGASSTSSSNLQKSYFVYEGQSYYIRATEPLCSNKELNDFSTDSSYVGKPVGFSIY